MSKLDNDIFINDNRISSDSLIVQNEVAKVPSYGKNECQNFGLLVSQSLKPDDIIIKPVTWSSVAQSDVPPPSSFSNKLKDEKQNGDSKHPTLNSLNTYSRSNSINNHRNRFSNKLGHKKSKR